jgi:hypothetical protein
MLSRSRHARWSFLQEFFVQLNCFVFLLDSPKYSRKGNKDYYFLPTSAIDRPQYFILLYKKVTNEITETKIQLFPQVTIHLKSIRQNILHVCRHYVADIYMCVSIGTWDHKSESLICDKHTHTPSIAYTKDSWVLHDCNHLRLLRMEELAFLQQ